jgi:hypothetical protein
VKDSQVRRFGIYVTGLCFGSVCGDPSSLAAGDHRENIKRPVVF